ncbi:MAG: Type 1 glutamine amidotransferase-like domain-containing protein [Anaerolineales bacterium]
MSPIALVGGNEFRRECDPLDRALIELAGGTGVAVAILPTAATNENPYVAGENGVRHLRRLGARADKLMVTDEDDANAADFAGALVDFPFVYFTSGDPIYLHDTLRGSRVWQAVLAIHQRGGLVAGSSAGAMVLGEWLWRFDGWVPGLNLAPGLAVLPHHATLAARWGGERMAASLPAGATLVGVDEATALLLPSLMVVGAGHVTIYGPDGPQAYPAGTQAALPQQPALGAGPPAETS